MLLYKLKHALGYCTDPGIEKSTIAVIQPVLRHNGTDEFADAASHQYGKSLSNQVKKLCI